MKTRPCVYLRHPRTGRAVFFATASDVDHGVLLARGLADIFEVPAWVADWVRIAHIPADEHEQAYQAARERVWA